MVGGTTHQQQQAPQLAPPSSISSSTAHTTTTEEDELLKRNTDCVYFLASPLTCKKGSECEYRHSDIARVNPRDCWYWLNGNCLNPKCAFRHPPLDGLLGADMSTPTGPSVPAAHATPFATPKQGVACIFFQKGFCLKGHHCPFLHGPPNAVNNKPTQSGSANPVSDPPKLPQSGPEKFIQEQKSTQHPTIPKVTPFPLRNGGNGGVDKRIDPPLSVEEPPRYKPARVVLPPVMNEKPSSKANRGVYHVPENDRILNAKDADEFSREPSPGFDVLVDNEVEDSEYYHDNDEYGRSRGQFYDLDRPVDYDVDRDMYHTQRERDSDNYNDASRHNPDHFNGSDLRHRISKQRRGSDHNSRSAVSRENHADRIPRRERESRHHRHHPDQGTLSSRLRGRIKIPGRSVSPTKENNSRVERDFDRERRHLSRYSPGRPLAINQGRLGDRIKGHRDMLSDNDSMFDGPKRLSELKSVRTEHQPNDEQFLGKRKYPKVENDLSFEGPKPLSEILKRKKGVNSNSSSNNNDNNSNDNNNNASFVKNEENKQKERETVPADNKEHNSVSVGFEAEIEKDEPVDDKSVNYAADEVENEVGLIDEDALLDEELEGYDDHRDGDYEYEHMDGEEDYNLDEGEYIDEEDGDEYEKKESVVYS